MKTEFGINKLLCNHQLPLVDNIYDISCLFKTALVAYWLCCLISSNCFRRYIRDCAFTRFIMRKATKTSSDKICKQFQSSLQLISQTFTIWKANLIETVYVIQERTKKKTTFVEMWNCVNTELIPFSARTGNLKNEKAKLKNSVEQEAIWIRRKLSRGIRDEESVARIVRLQQKLRFRPHASAALHRK